MCLPTKSALFVTAAGLLASPVGAWSWTGVGHPTPRLRAVQSFTHIDDCNALYRATAEADQTLHRTGQRDTAKQFRNMARKVRGTDGQCHVGNGHVMASRHCSTSPKVKRGARPKERQRGATGRSSHTPSAEESAKIRKRV